MGRKESRKKTSIVVLSYNTLEYTQLCINSIRKYTQPGSYEIIVVDNGSADGSAEWLKQQGDLKCLYNVENVGFPAGCNQGMRLAAGSEILLLNSDTIVTPRWLAQLKAALYSDACVGAVSCVTNHCSNEQQIDTDYQGSAGLMAFAETYNCSDPGKWEERLVLVGFCLLFKREVYDKIGDMDEAFTPGNYEDDDYCLRIWQAGYKLLLCRDTFIHHFGSTSFSRDMGEAEREKKVERYNCLLKRNFAYFQKKWGISDQYKVLHEFACFLPAVLPAGTRLLEVDCGCGMDFFKLMGQYHGLQLEGLTRCAGEAAIAHSAGLAVRPCTALVPDVFERIQGVYDYILLCDITEAELHAGNFLERLRQYLTPAGKLFFPLKDQLYGIGHPDAAVPAAVNQVLDENKICFITCVNDEAKYQQCVEQLRQLAVPAGMQVELLAVRGADSMAAGYQKGMCQSDAKYKIYLHQDVWIVHRQMLNVLIEQFQQHPEYGIAGVVGSASIPADGVWWESPQLFGAIYDDHTGIMRPYKYRCLAKNCLEAAALDGLLLATQYDVDWRADLFPRWHFYDLSQCLEFRRAGYKAVVLPQTMPWCRHFCGQNAMQGYDEARQVFLKEYRAELMDKE